MSDIRPGVLIISDRWGSPFQGGIPAAIRLLASLYHSVGLTVNSTVLHVTETEEREANDLNIELIFPKPRGTLKQQKPNRSWLQSPESYFRNLKDIKNIQIILEFALATSEASLTIRDDIFPSAKLHITNLWPSEDDSLTSVVGCNKKVLEDLINMLEEEQHKEASLIASIDHQTFQYYNVRLEAQNHFQILPTPDEKMFTFKLPKMLPEGKQVYQIVSCLEEHDIDEMNNQKQLAEAINIVAENFHSTQKTPPTWLLHGVNEAMEDKVKQILKPHTHLKIIPSNKQSSAFLKKVLRLSHLVLIPPNSPGMNSLHLLISTMAVGIPLLVSLYSPCHDLIKEYFPEYMDDMVVDMMDPQLFAERIHRVISNYEASIKKAAEVKQFLETVASKSIGEINGVFISQVSEDTESHISVERREVHSPGDTGADDNPTHGIQETGQENIEQTVHNVFQSSEDPEDENEESTTVDNGTHSRGQINLHVIPSGIPVGNRTMAQVTQEYCLLREVIEDTPRQLEAIHPDITAEGTSTGSMTYHLKCKTLDALICLWNQYQTRKLKKMITSTTITEETLNKIGAIYLEHTTKLHFEEYEQCRKELSQTGMDVDKLMILEVDPSIISLLPVNNYLTSIFNAGESCIRRRQSQYVVQLFFAMTDNVQYILSSRQEVLALLGVRRYLLNNLGFENLTIDELEESLSQAPKLSPLPQIAERNISPLLESLLLAKISPSQTIHYVVEYLLDLWQKEPSKALKQSLKLQLHETEEQKENFKAKCLELTEQLDTNEKAYMRKCIEMKEEYMVELEKKDKVINDLGAKLSQHAVSEPELGRIRDEHQHVRDGNDKTEVISAEIHPAMDSENGNSQLMSPTIQPTQTSVQMTERETEGIAALAPVAQADPILEDIQSTSSTEEIPAVAPTQIIFETKQKKGKKASGVTKFLRRLSFRKKASGYWSVRLLDGQGPKPGRKFKEPRGMVFLGDQLVVCDPDNNIVQILNEDYSCDKVLGSFDGQFAQPFKPWDVAISNESHFYINDRGNIQIVVCNLINQILRIIALTGDICPYGIAVMVGFVFVTDVRHHYLRKYTEDGQFIAQVNGEGNGTIPFNLPFFVAVNSKNVIMVSDSQNHCIKCFDSKLNYLYQFGRYGVHDGEIAIPTRIAVDEDDNVYVCDSANNRIVKWRSDRKWVCNLFRQDVSSPWQVAAHGDRIAVTESGAGHIKMFSE
ncbi:uncharacterized protein [Ptychodera flava]|uniref:uncharacterized protein isoform X2 n=1 Tax=Ptychodera flava TaxID=63121 RepID=UPI00396A02D4